MRATTLIKDYQQRYRRTEQSKKDLATTPTRKVPSKPQRGFRGEMRHRFREHKLNQNCHYYASQAQRTESVTSNRACLKHILHCSTPFRNLASQYPPQQRYDLIQWRNPTNPQVNAQGYMVYSSLGSQ